MLYYCEVWDYGAVATLTPYITIPIDDEYGSHAPKISKARFDRYCFVLIFLKFANAFKLACDSFAVFLYYCSGP